jgi:putative membrane protein
MLVFFWTKVGSFAVIGLLSVPPTRAFIRWRKLGTTPNDAAIREVRRYLHIELMLFVLLPIFAAAMARGYGEL